jgi:hypothetical protein
MPNLETLAKAVAELLEGKLEADEGVYHLTAPVVGEDDDEVDPDHTQTVTLYPEGEGDELIMIFCEVGPYDGEVDLEYILRGLSDAAFARVYIAAPDDDEKDAEEGLAVEAGLLAAGITAEQLAEVVQEVINVADFVEDVLEGGAD